MRERYGAGKSLVVVSIVVAFLLGLGAMYAAAPSLIGTSSSGSSSATAALYNCPKNVCTIGGLRDLSGVNSGEGIGAKIAMQLAITDINNYVQQTGSPVRFQTVIDDAASDPTTALQNFQNLVSQGIQVCVCTDTSGEAGNLLSYANAHHVVVLGITSSPKLAIANDYLFRIYPDDSHDGPVEAAIVWQQGYRAMIIVYRNDPFGSASANSTAVAFKGMGGTVVDQISYNPVSTGSYDFTATLSQLNSDYQNAVSQFGQGKVEIVQFGFSEIAVMLQQAKTLYPNLLQIPWHGSNGIAGDASVISGNGSLEAQVKLVSGSFVPENSSKLQAFVQKEKNLAGGTFNLGGAAGTYDEMWLAALSILHCGGDNGTCIQHVIPTVADNYYGEVGWTHLNAAGDLASADYGIWSIANVNGKVQWVQDGVYSSATNSITWNRTP